MSKELVQTSFRLPPELLSQLKAAAEAQNRTLSGEIVTACQRHLADPSRVREVVISSGQ
ncbi:Arc family DNA-binding protein [Synechococcus sp. BIOS-E4-1]|uniref:Arc family DNA-binding protein n=1 Tax=Synechococcus sp. BIOS-E4-1 TaxID=1400864 RepID=UPI00164447AB|nr:Arc family DNA-binding protein [Synechococcus sp. BIOS-E4-1]